MAVLQPSYLDHLVRPCWDLLGRPFPDRDRRDLPAASDLAAVDPNLVPSSGADIRGRGPFRAACRVDLGEDPGGVVREVDREEVLAAVRAVHLADPSVVRGVDQDDLAGQGDVAACVAVVREGLVRVVLACGVAEVDPGVLPVPAGVVHSCAGRVAVREGSAVEGHRAAAEVPASACGHPVPGAAPEDRAGGAVLVLVPYEEALGVAPAEAGTDCAATGRGRDSATVAPSDSEPAAAASGYLLAKDSPFPTPKINHSSTIAQFSPFFPRKQKTSQSNNSAKKMAADGKTLNRP